MPIPKRSWKFTQIIKPLLFAMTIPGFRPFAMPGEPCAFKNFSVVGAIFWIPVPLLTGYVLYNCLKVLIEYSAIYGLFDGRTIFYVAIILMVLYQFIYVLIMPIYASKMYLCLANLDTITLNAKNRARFVRLFYFGFPCLFVFAIAICASVASSSIDQIAQAGVAVPIWHYITTYETTSALIVFVFPLSLLILMARYVGMAFSENVEKLKGCHEDQLEKRLPELYYSYLNLTKATQLIDDCFACLVLGAIGINGINICIFLLNITLFITLPTLMLVPVVFLAVSNFAGYSYICTWLNDESRAIREHLHDVGPANQTVHHWICGALTTFIAFYAQFNTSAPSDFVFNATKILEHT